MWEAEPPSHRPLGPDQNLARVLLVSTDSQLRTMVRSAVPEANHELIAVGTAEEARRVLDERQISLLIIDLVLPDGDGRVLLHGLRERPGNATLPVMVAGAAAGPRTQSECFRLGADQFLSKPIDPQVLTASVQSKLQRAAEIRRESRYDPLTGLPNRAAFGETYARAVALARRNDEPLSVAIIDLDHFKSVNDRFGHAQGDDVLRELAHIARDALRRSDMLARWGGEEFVVLLPETDAAGAERALLHVRERVNETRWRTARGQEFGVTFSAGIADASGGTPLSEVVARADYYLYLAKATGRDRIISDASDVETPARRVLVAERDELTASTIRHRLAREGFEVVHHSDFEAASEVTPEPEIALALIDVTAPHAAGFELLERLRSRPDFESVPIVMMTGLGAGGDTAIPQGIELGADDYLVKPFSADRLMRLVQRHLRGRVQHEAPEQTAGTEGA